MEDFGTLIATRTIGFERLLSGPVETAWAYLTQDAFLRCWLGSGEIEERVGASIRLCLLTDETAVQAATSVTGVVWRCEPPHLLEYTWIAPVAEDQSYTSIVTFTLKVQGEQTLLTLTQRPLLLEQRSQILSGWHAQLDRLQSVLAGETASPFSEIFQRVRPEYERRLGALGAE